MPQKWKSHEEYYNAALEERNLQLEKFHPDNWDLDHDHRLVSYLFYRMKYQRVNLELSKI